MFNDWKQKKMQYFFLYNKLKGVRGEQNCCDSFVILLFGNTMFFIPCRPLLPSHTEMQDSSYLYSPFSDSQFTELPRCKSMIDSVSNLNASKNEPLVRSWVQKGTRDCPGAQGQSKVTPCGLPCWCLSWSHKKKRHNYLSGTVILLCQWQLDRSDFKAKMSLLHLGLVFCLFWYIYIFFFFSWIP